MASPVSSCSSDFDAAETFAESLMDQINREDVRNMVKTQRDMLSRFEKTNEMLINFNILSADRFTVTSQQFTKHTQLMYEMKKDLDSIFKRIRVVKQRLEKVYPDAFKACGNVTPLLEDDEDAELNMEQNTDTVNSKHLPTASVNQQTSELNQPSSVDNQSVSKTVKADVHSEPSLNN